MGKSLTNTKYIRHRMIMERPREHEVERFRRRMRSTHQQPEDKILSIGNGSGKCRSNFDGTGTDDRADLKQKKSHGCLKWNLLQ